MTNCKDKVSVPTLYGSMSQHDTQQQLTFQPFFNGEFMAQGTTQYSLNDPQSSSSICSSSSSFENWLNCLDNTSISSVSQQPENIRTKDKRSFMNPKMYLSFPSSDIVQPNIQNYKNGRTTKVLKNRFNQWILFAEKSKNVDLTIKIIDHPLELNDLYEYRLRFTPIAYSNGRKSPIDNISSFMEFRGFDMISSRELSHPGEDLHSQITYNTLVDRYTILEVRLPEHLKETFDSDLHFTIPMKIAFPYLNSKCIGKTRKDIYILVELFHKEERICCSQFFVISCACPTRDSERYLKRNTQVQARNLKRKIPIIPSPKITDEQYVITTDDENIYRTLCLVKDQMLNLKRTLQSSLVENKNQTQPLEKREDFDLISTLDNELLAEDIAEVFDNFDPTNA